MKRETVEIEVDADQYAALHKLKQRLEGVENTPMVILSISPAEVVVGTREVAVAVEIEEERDPRELLGKALAAEMTRDDTPPKGGSPREV